MTLLPRQVVFPIAKSISEGWRYMQVILSVSVFTSFSRHVHRVQVSPSHYRIRHRQERASSMKAPAMALPASGSLGVSAQDLAMLEILADSIIEDTLQSYEAFRDAPDARCVDPKRWKPLRHAGHVTVYKDRKSVRPTTQKLRAADGLLSPVHSKYSTPSLLAVGTVRGSLDDSLYGDYFDSDENAQLRAAYVKGQPYEDFRVLQQIRMPTVDEPFRFCGLVWATLVNSGRPFVQQRDVCLLVSCGEAFTKRGERFGYRVEHSVRLPGLPPLKDAKLIRAKMSLCCLKWPLDHDVAGNGDTLEVFQRGFFAPMGSAREHAVSRHVVNSLLLTPLTLEAALSKKLVWMRNHTPGRKRTCVLPLRSPSCPVLMSPSDWDPIGRTVGRHTRASAITSAVGRTNSVALGQACAGRCESRFGGGGNVVCTICRTRVCSTCKRVRKIVVDVTAVGATQRPLIFCSVCVAMAAQRSAAALARQEILFGDGFAAEDGAVWATHVSVGDLGSRQRGQDSPRPANRGTTLF